MTEQLATPEEFGLLLGNVARGGVLVLAGAGLSTATGLPDYRGPDGVRRSEPMTVSQFRATPAARRRYWTRSYAGWERFSAATPSAGHRVLARWERLGLLDHIITQNVDGLEAAAGATEVTQLHGRLDQVICLQCTTVFERQWMQEEFADLNPHFAAAAAEARNLPLRPDGDVDIDPSLADDVDLVHCPVCGSDQIKPHVVMFGESVAKPVVEESFERVDRARSVLVVGSSLGVMSGYRFARHAVRQGTPLLLLNTGWSRADDIATLHVHDDLQAVLRRLDAEIR